MAGLPEDRRAAVSLRVGLSSNLISAALAVLGAQAAITTFILDKREYLIWFYIWGVLAWALLVISMYLGGKGIAEEYKSGFNGDWQEKSTKGQFRLQTLCAMTGVTLVFLSLFCGSPKPDAELQKESGLIREINELKVQTYRLQERSDSDQLVLNTLRDEVRKISEAKSVNQAVSKHKRKIPPKHRFKQNRSSTNQNLTVH